MRFQQQDGTKNLEKWPKSADVTLRKVTVHGPGGFCAQQRKFNGFYKASSDLTLRAQLCGVSFARVEPPQSSGTAHLVTKGFFRHLLFPLLLPLILSGAVQAQSFLFKTQTATRKFLSLVPRGGIYSPALPCALAEGCLCLSGAGNHVHDTFITSDFGKKSYKML